MMFLHRLINFVKASTFPDDQELRFLFHSGDGLWYNRQE